MRSQTLVTLGHKRTELGSSSSLLEKWLIRASTVEDLDDNSISATILELVGPKLKELWIAGLLLLLLYHNIEHQLRGFDTLGVFHLSLRILVSSFQ